ncbi:hypothetical protein H4S04_005782 [Coemansia sp. S16]|nr:hypothetical protein H4S03_004205 [Coemansia sp. S3946]KAJ2045196.1 hypothetical protein H4S04_005782 [Coemansia sp. S16]KAJ2344563.1 hypothetical protein GGH92_004428 [Coemansia sp. RSA 2673]
MTDAVTEVSQVPEVKKDKVKLVVCDVIAKTSKPILEIIEKPKVGEMVVKSLVGEVAKQVPAPSPAA